MPNCDNPNYVAITGVVGISTANSNLDGTGSMGTVLTAADDGTLINTITLKAAESNEQGMIRLFITKGGNTMLWREFPVPANVQSSTNSAYEHTVVAQFSLEAGDILKASTQNAESWVVTADAIKWINNPEPTEQLDAPATLVLTGIDQGINCNCDDVTNADDYEWERADDSGFSTNVVTGSLSLSEFTFGGLTNSQTYYIRVRARGDGYLDSNWTSGSVAAGV